MIIVSVNRIRACKKLVLYFRFLETAARQISECKGQFEMLPESSQASSLNLAFASDYLDIKEIRDFGFKIKDYFKLSPGFLYMVSNHAMVDPELKRHCEAVKYQKASMKDLAEYYVSYMDRMGKEADPKVKSKLQAKEYSDSIAPVNPGFPGAPGFGGSFPGQGGAGFGGQPQFPQPPGGPSFGGAGGFNMGGGYGAAPGGPGFGGAGGPPFGGAGGQSFGGAGGPSFGGAGGYNMGGGYGAPQGNNFNPGQGAPQGFQGGYGNNPFSPSGPQGFGGAPQMGGQGGFPGAPSQNPFSQQPQQYAKPPITSVNMQNPSPYNPPGYQNLQGQDPTKQFDDIFGDPKVPVQNATFGGDKKPSNQVNSTDDFLKQLEDLKKL